MCSADLHDLDRSLAGVEKAFNVLGWIPFVSSISGGVRILAGKVQVAAFASLAVGAYIFGCVLENEKLMYSAARFSRYVWHGLANVCRGFVEMIPFAGNLLTILYDSDPNVRMRYPQEWQYRTLIPFRVRA